MKPSRVIWMVVLLLFGAGPVCAEGFRGRFGVAPNVGRAGQGGFVTSPVNPRSRTTEHFSPTGSSQQTHIWHRRGSVPTIVLPQAVPPLTGINIPGSLSSGASRTAPVFVTTPVHVPGRFHPHGQPHFHPRFRKPSGIVILEVPRSVSVTVTTQIVPNGGGGQRPAPETPPADVSIRSPGQLAPFDPTPHDVVERMLALARVKSSDVLYDLGAGDGRIAIGAAKKYGIKAVGIEIDAGLVKLARENVSQHGVEHLVEIRQQDFLTADLSAATVVTLYLSYDGNLAVRPMLFNQLKSGARVVSYTFDMGDWQPKIVESYRDKGGDTHMIYLWEIGASLLFSDSRR